MPFRTLGRSSKREGQAKISEEKHKKQTPESLQSSNTIRAHRAAEEGQFHNAIKSLTSGGLSKPSAEVLEEMLAKHPQEHPTPSPSGPVPKPSRYESDVIKALRSFPSGIAPGPSSFRDNHFTKRLYSVPLQTRPTLPSKLYWVWLTYCVLVELLPKSFPTSVVPLSKSARRKVVAFGQSPWMKSLTTLPPNASHGP